MRAVIQRVGRASCTVDGQVTGRIGRGLLAFLGVGREDTAADRDILVDKIVNLRIFPDENGKMNLSVKDIGGGVLLISQFTLYGDCRKGRRPDFSSAGRPEAARRLYEEAAETIRSAGVEVQTGLFAAHMDIDSLNDGPVTLMLDSRKAF